MSSLHWLVGALTTSLVAPVSQAQEPKFSRLRGTLTGEGVELGVGPYSQYVGDQAAVGDVDGDGHIDLIHSAPLRLWRGNALGTFTNLPQRLEGEHLPKLVDIDLDGDLDLLSTVQVMVGRKTKTEVGVYENDSAGNFARVQTIAVPFDALPTTLAVGDLDGDRYPDLFIGASVPRLATLWMNDGFGRYVDSSARLPTGVRADSGFVCDAEGDGDLDLLIRTPNQNASNLKVLRNDGSASFAVEFVVDATTLGAFYRPHDFTGDGLVDILTGGFRTNGTRILENDGTGAFRAPVLIHPGRFFGEAQIQDFDGDGLADLLFANGPAPNHLRNLGGLAFEDLSAALPASEFSQEVIAFDADNDGDADAMVGSLELALWRNDGTGSFRDVTGEVPEGSGRTTSSVVGDLDGDAFPDAVVAEWDGNARVFWNRGSGQFERTTTTFRGTPTLADIDGDGDLDVFASSLLGIELWRNEGRRAFVDVSAQLPWSGLFGALHVEDVDADGDPDLMLATASQNVLALNDGDGRFEDVTAQRMPTRFDDTDFFVSGDLDGDGDRDLVALNDLDPSRVLLNDGAAFFREREGEVFDTLPSRGGEAHLSDMDGDGDLDLVGGAGVLQYFENDGDGFFSDLTSEKIGLVLLSGDSVTPSDLDDDGDVDVYLGSGKILFNQGDGTLVEGLEPLPRLKNRGQHAAVADLDVDGDLDIWVSGRTQIHFNTRRQIARDGVASIGKPFEVDLYGEAGSRWILFSSTGRGRSDSPYGQLLLDPRALRLVGTGLLDAAGRATVPLRTPPDPSLVGQERYMQAILGSPARWSNLEILDLTGL